MADLKLKFKMPDDESLANYISIKGEKGERGDPTKLSQLDNDTGFITNAVTNLLNYYSKSESYSQAQVDSLLANSKRIDGQDLNTLIGERIVGYGNGCTNKPTNSNGYFINIPHSYSEHKNNYNKQFWLVRDTNVIYARTQANGNFSDWVRINPDMTQYYTKTESDTLRNTNDYYDEITYTKERFFDTDCYFVTIPMTDSAGDEIELYIGDAGSSGSPITYARDNHTTFTSNATLNMGGSIGVGSLIANGQIVRDIDTSGVQYDANLYLGIKENRVLAEYQVNQTTAQQMLNDGCLQAWYVYYKILDNGTVIDMSEVVVGDPTVPTARNPRQCLGQKADGTIIMLSCDGRTSINAGLTSEETAQLLLNKGCVNAWNLDGGGSASTEIKESKLNRNIDSDGTADRKIRYTLNVKKPTTNTAVAKAYSKISEEKQNVIQQLVPLINAAAATGLQANTVNIHGQDLNDLVDKIYIGYGNGDQHRPTEAWSSGYFINIPHSEAQYVGLYAKQLYLERDGGKIWTRRLVNGTFTNWVRIYRTEKAFLRGGTQTIAVDNTYQEIMLNPTGITIDGTAITQANFNESETAYTGFKIAKTGYVRIYAQLQYTAVTAGTKYISLYKNNTQIGQSTTRFTGQQGIETLAMLNVIDEYTNTEAIYTLKAYGATGDQIERVKIIVEMS